MTIPYYLTEKLFGSSFLALSCLGGELAWRWPHLALACNIWALTVMGVVVNSMYWVLPLPCTLHPERVALLLLLPCALNIGALLDSVRTFVAKAEVMLGIIAVLVLFVTVREHERLVYQGGGHRSLLTEADLKGMRWIRANTGPGNVFHDRSGDAGLWIPAVAFRHNRPRSTNLRNLRWRFWNSMASAYIRDRSAQTKMPTRPRCRGIECQIGWLKNCHKSLPGSKSYPSAIWP